MGSARLSLVIAGMTACAVTLVASGCGLEIGLPGGGDPPAPVAVPAMPEPSFEVVITTGAQPELQDDGKAAKEKKEEGKGESAKPQPLPKVKLDSPWPDLEFDKPLWVGMVNDGTKRLFVLEQDGRIYWFDPSDKKPEKQLFLDISAKTYRGHNEEGLLALAFHPEFKKNRLFYIHYSLKGEVEQQGRRKVDTRYGILARLKASKDGKKADPASETEIFRIKQPWGNHNGCDMHFAKDGTLYFSLGDGGAGGDPLNSGQDLGSHLGKILRINVDKEEKGRKYAIPEDNPFVSRAGAQPEIWAYGLRNIWRMSFDPDGNLWGGDVGQNAWEEIDVIIKGGNYGWRIREGAHEFKKGESGENLIEPIVEYAQSGENGRSVTGGYVYRGKKIAGLVGAYIYGDYQSGRIWGLRHKDGKALLNEVVLDSRVLISSFGEDPDGEILVCAHNRSGRIFRLAEAEPKKQQK